VLPTTNARLHNPTPQHPTIRPPLQPQPETRQTIVEMDHITLIAKHKRSSRPSIQPRYRMLAAHLSTPAR
jgi:hypothetical protein